MTNLSDHLAMVLFFQVFKVIRQGFRKKTSDKKGPLKLMSLLVQEDP